MLEITIANGNLLKFKRGAVVSVEVPEDFETCAEIGARFSAKLFFAGGWSINVVDTRARIKAAIDGMVNV
jgi:hypothetical protein